MARFSEPPNLAVITTKRVLEGAPIVLVAHDEDDGGWQFLCGTTNDPADGRVVSLAGIVSGDPSVEELADLPVGWQASRAKLGDPWVRAKQDR
jgi:hypothetical protein